MANPATKTIAERYNWLLKRTGSHEKVMQAASDELAAQKRNKNQDHLEVKRNIEKINEIINYGKNLK